MDAVIKSIVPDSPAARTIIAPGDTLRRINGGCVGDVLDYKYLIYDRELILELDDAGGKMKLVRLRKPEGADVGLVFGSFLMDKQRSCANKCIFCFIDQLPDGMRETLYYKDDDVRLSFLQGNYVTLTNLSAHDIARIMRLQISPINVSVHTLDPKLRAFMLGTKRGAAGIKALESFVLSGITLNCQIVCCPGINDGEALDRTIRRLYRLGPGINSVSVVPVGLTRHRDGLTPLRPFDGDLAYKTVRRVESFARECLKRRGKRVFFCADELYIKARLKLPPHKAYEDYPQLENGVGMMRLFIKQFLGELNKRGAGIRASGEPLSVVTGMAAGKHLSNLLKLAVDKYGTIKSNVYPVRNEFFGESVTVSGLITGGDIITQLKDRDLGVRLLVPQNMLRRGEDVFLDDVTIPELSAKLGVEVRIVNQDGADLLNAILGD